MLMKIPARSRNGFPDCEAPVAGANVSGEYAMNMDGIPVRPAQRMC